PFRLETFAAWFDATRSRHVSRLLELIAIPTESPHEEACYPWLLERISALGGVARMEPPPANFERHESFTSTYVDAPHRSNLRAHFPSATPGAPRLLLNAHVDVVPPVEFPRGYAPVIAGGEVIGRGAADTKNNIVMLFGALEFLCDAGLPPAYDLYADFVVEEEIGGN